MKIPAFIFLFLLLTQFAFAQAENKSKKSLFQINLAAVKSPKGIEIKLNSPKFDDFLEILVERSNALNGVYRQIKIIYRPELEKAINEITFKDEFPLNIQNASYYRLRVTTTDSIIITYPGVEEESYITFNKERQKVYTPVSAVKKTNEQPEEVAEILTAEHDEKFEQLASKKSSTFIESIKDTKFQVSKSSDTARKITIELSQIQQIDKLFILINNESNKSYYTMKEMNRDEIERSYDKGFIEYSFNINSIIRQDSSYSIKLRLMHESEEFETAAVDFN